MDRYITKHIISYLDDWNIEKCKLVCKSWNKIAMNLIPNYYINTIDDIPQLQKIIRLLKEDKIIKILKIFRIYPARNYFVLEQLMAHMMNMRYFNIILLSFPGKFNINEIKKKALKIDNKVIINYINQMEKYKDEQKGSK